MIARLRWLASHRPQPAPDPHLADAVREALAAADLIEPAPGLDRIQARTQDRSWLDRLRDWWHRDHLGADAGPGLARSLGDAFSRKTP